MNSTDKSSNSIFGKDALFSQRYRSGTPHHITSKKIQPTIRSTKPSSSFATSLLKFCTSCQQSSGRRSCSLKQLATSAWAFATLPSNSASFFRPSSLSLSSSISEFTDSRFRSWLMGTAVSTAAGAAGVYSRPANGIRGASRSSEPAG